MEFPPLLVRDIPVIKSQMMFRLFDNLTKVIKSSSGVICNTFEELEHPALTLAQEVLSVPVFLIGPFHKCCLTSSSSSLTAEDRSCISWLDGQPLKSVIYMSFGSVAVVSEAEISEIELGLADSDQPFL
ncbi:UDP-glycosyltransferase 76C2-like [Rhodamnia argentea]|uniref:UDP-glycosyltransferase 76C2-like n=1 Tax=Rhodamnia argentea TaxID=178133 RepID=A0ABM3HFF7_9MYRT|nr:UDP-glycosyltransferase 76C2-like [Rhodamnia argentea]